LIRWGAGLTDKLMRRTGFTMAAIESRSLRHQKRWRTGDAAAFSLV
jgi:hypothetical protein